MTDTKTEVATSHLSRVGGGGCTPEDYITIVGQLTDAYEALIDFTGYVMGRVVGDPPSQP